MPENFLRGTAIIQVVDDGVTTSGIPSTLQRIYSIVGNVDSASSEVHQNLVLARLAMETGREDAYVCINSMITGTGVITAGYSALKFKVTTNPTAKGFYAASIAFSSGAVASGGVAVLTRMCKVSEVALLSEVMGGGFLWLGEMAHAEALRAEGKPIPPHLQKWAKRRIPLRRTFDNNQNLSFVMPGNFHGMSARGLSDIIECIPFETIGKIVGVGLTAYGYYKIVVTSYRYSQKLITKVKEHQQNKLKKYRSKLLHRQINFLVISICNCPSVRRRLLIYYQLKVS